VIGNSPLFQVPEYLLNGYRIFPAGIDTHKLSQMRPYLIVVGKRRYNIFYQLIAGLIFQAHD